MKNLQEVSAWVNEIVDNAISTEKKQQSKRCYKAHKR